MTAVRMIRPDSSARSVASLGTIMPASGPSRRRSATVNPSAPLNRNEGIRGPSAAQGDHRAVEDQRRTGTRPRENRYYIGLARTSSTPHSSFAARKGSATMRDLSAPGGITIEKGIRFLSS
jgi:hypothetical protein